MNFKERRKVYNEATFLWGTRAQHVVAMEEFAELINVVAKQLNEKNERGVEGLVDELADARIMVEQLEMMYDCTESVQVRMGKKLERLQERIHEGIINGGRHR